MENPISSVKELIARYVKLRIDEIRLEALERVVAVTGYFIFTAISFILIFAMFCFCLLGIAEYLSALFESKAMGYFAVAGILLILFIIVFAMKRKLMNMVSSKFLNLLTKPRRKKR